MEYNLYAIHDAATGFFGAPMAQDNDAVAMRSFAHECYKEDSVWNSHASDFSLFFVGTYTAETGEVNPVTPFVVCRATDFVKPKRKGAK